MAKVSAVTKQGLYDGSSVVNALEPTIDIVTTQLINAVATTSQRIYFPSGITPKAVMFWMNGSRNAIGTGYSNGNSCVGWSDGTNDYCVFKMIDSETTPSTQEAIHAHSSATAVRWHQTAPYTSTLDRGHTVTGFGAGYVDLQTTVDTSADEDKYITIIAFGGAKVTSAKVWTKDDLGTGTSAVPITGVGFTPSMSFMATVNQSEVLSAYDDGTRAAQTGLQYSCGLAINGGGQGCYGLATAQSDPNPVTTTTVVSNARALYVPTAAGATAYHLTASNWGADGFDLTPSASTSSAICGGLALEFSSDIQLGLVDTTYPTTGDYAQTDVGFLSLLGIIMAVDGVTTYDTATTANGGEGIGIFTDNRIYGHTVSWVSGIDSHDGASQSVLQRRLTLLQGQTSPSNASDVVVSSTYAMDSAGWDIGLTTNPGTEIKGIGLAIGI